MINPFLKHPLLQHLPYEQLKNPTSDGIKIFIKKRRRNLLIVAIVSIIAAIISLLTDSNISLLSLIYPLLLIVMSILLFKQSLNSKIDDEEINKVLQEYSGYNNGKPA